MATLKLKKSPHKQDKDARQARAPVRGQGSAPRERPTLSQAQAARAEREARYQEQLRQRLPLWGHLPRLVLTESRLSATLSCGMLLSWK